MNKQTREDILEVKGKVYKRTSVSSTRLRQKMRIKVSALDYAMEGVLSIECINEKQRLVAFLSKSLNKTKKTMRFIIRRCWQ